MSVKCDFPSVSFQRSQVSIVPNKIFLFEIFFLLETLFNTHLIFVAEKYGSKTKPVIFCIILSLFCVFNFSQYSAVLLSCHTIALYRGFPVILFQRTVVSLWLVMPIEAIWFGLSLFFLIVN